MNERRIPETKESEARIESLEKKSAEESTDLDEVELIKLEFQVAKEIANILVKSNLPYYKAISVIAGLRVRLEYEATLQPTKLHTSDIN